MACANGSAPLLLPWANNSVSAAGTILSRGISFSIGTPAQPFSLTPSTRSNNLFVNNAAECKAATNSSCIGQLGGIYDSATSTTFKQVNYAVWEGSRDSVDLASSSSYVFFDDAIAFGLKPQTNKFALYPGYTNGSTDGKSSQNGFWEHGLTTPEASANALLFDEPNYQATLPLGPNSTFLNHLVDSGQASSRTYGLWVGSESEETPQDGLLVVGGYDESRLKAPATTTTFPMYSDCPNCAILTAITYDAGGTSTSLFSATTDTLIVHLDPYSSDIQLPPAMLQNLGGAEKTAVWNATSRRYEFPATTAPTGTITVTISDLGAPAGDASKPSVATYKTVIPATELFARPRAYNDKGIYEVNNATIYNMAVTNTTGSIRFGTLGLPFFTQNYLIVDPDAQNFQLAPAVTTADPKGANQKIKQICRVPLTGKSKFPVGAIAGAVVGSIIGTLLLVALFLFLRKRRNNAKQAQHSRDESVAATTTSTNPLYPPHRPSASENESLELPMQYPPPAAMALRDGMVFPSPARSTRSRTGNEDPRRGLAHEVFRRQDEENDGRLLGERPLGLSETIHSKTSLPRIVAEHDV